MTISDDRNSAFALLSQGALHASDHILDALQRCLLDEFVSFFSVTDAYMPIGCHIYCLDWKSRGYGAPKDAFESRAGRIYLRLVVIYVPVPSKRSYCFHCGEQCIHVHAWCQQILQPKMVLLMCVGSKSRISMRAASFPRPIFSRIDHWQSRLRRGKALSVAPIGSREKAFPGFTPV
jgi:hypothetical protein